MWILVDVNDPIDVGKNEKRRVLLNDINIMPDSTTFHNLFISGAIGHDVHPATQEKK